MPGDHKSAKPAVIVQEVCHFLYWNKQELIQAYNLLE
jgi:hypothetical protein